MGLDRYLRKRQPSMLAAACLCLLACSSLGFAPCARADNPGYDRSGIGFTPVVLGAGQVTLEQGLPDVSRDRQDDIGTSLYSADSLLRLGLGGPLELQLGGSAYNRLVVDEPGTHHASHGRGDSSLGLKFALPATGSAFSWGLLGSVELTDGARDFRNDRRQYLFGAQFNLQLDASNSLGAYLQDVRAGGRDTTEFAVSDNLTLAPTLGAYAEAAVLHVPHRGAGSLFGIGLAWQPTAHLQFDAGLDRGLGGAAPQWQANLGASIFFGR